MSSAPNSTLGHWLMNHHRQLQTVCYSHWQRIGFEVYVSEQLKLCTLGAYIAAFLFLGLWRRSSAFPGWFVDACPFGIFAPVFLRERGAILWPEMNFNELIQFRLANLSGPGVFWW